MKIVEKYILKEMKLPILFGISIFTFIFLIDIIVAMMENIIVRGISLVDTIRILSFYFPPILAQTIPMGVFLGVMTTFSKLTRNSESIAMSSMGLSLKDILSPIIKLTIIITLFIFFLQELIIPKSFEKLQYITTKIALENPTFQMKEKTFIDDIDEFSIYIDKIDKKDAVSSGVLIFQKDKNSNYPTVIVGEKAFWKNDAMVLSDSEFYKFKNDGSMEIKGEFKEKIIPLSAYATDIKIKLKNIEAMGISGLLKESKAHTGEEKIKYNVEINKRIAVPISVIILGIFGVLLANGHHRSGKGASFALSLLIIFSYIMVLNIGVVLANRGLVPSVIGVWTSNVILALITYFVYKTKAKVM
ncbi:MAG: LptF/LptG family permease [Fusobacteriaceae bacterium]